MNARFVTLLVACAVGTHDAFAQDTLAQDRPVTEQPAQEQIVETTAAPTTDSTSANEKSRPSSGPNAVRADRLDLDTTVVTGNRELPKVLYIVPWKKAELGELPAQPFNTLLDEVLAPVDREEFRREVKYYGTVAAKDPPAGDEPR